MTNESEARTVVAPVQLFEPVAGPRPPAELHPLVTTPITAPDEIDDVLDDPEAEPEPAPVTAPTAAQSGQDAGMAGTAKTPAKN